MNRRFEGKTAVVTGAASGIGLALAQRFLAEGAKVVASDVSEDNLHRLDGASGFGVALWASVRARLSWEVAAAAADRTRVILCPRRCSLSHHMHVPPVVTGPFRRPSLIRLILMGAKGVFHAPPGERPCGPPGHSNTTNSEP